MTSDTQNAVTTGYPLVIPAITSQPQARLVLRNHLGQVVQQWLVKQNKCTLGSASSCNLRCEMPGIAPYHALLVIGVRQTFVRALAPKLTRGGAPINELLLSEENSTFELAGHRFELSRQGAAKRLTPSEDPSKLASGLRFTLARPFELQNRPKPLATSGNPKIQAEPVVNSPETIAPWMAKLIQSAIEPLECQLHNALKPIAELQAEVRRRKQVYRSRRTNRGEQAKATADASAAPQPAAPNTVLQQQIEEVLARQSGAMDTLAERISDVSEQLATIERVVAQERAATEHTAKRTNAEVDAQVDVRNQQNTAIEQLQTGIVAVSTALESLQARQSAVESESMQWREEVQSELGAIRASLQAAGDRQAAVQESPVIIEALTRLQASQLESHDEIKGWKLDVQHQMDQLRDAFSASENSALPSAVTACLENFDQRFTESLQGIGAWKADVLLQLTNLREELAKTQAAEPALPAPTAELPANPVAASWEMVEPPAPSQEPTAVLPEPPARSDARRAAYTAYPDVDNAITAEGWPQLNVPTSAGDFAADGEWSIPQADSLPIPASNDAYAYAYDDCEAQVFDSEFVYGIAEDASPLDEEANPAESQSLVELAHADSRLEQERFEQERLEQEQLEQEQLVQEQLVQERLEQEQLVQERLEQEQLVQERLEQEQLVQEQLEQEQLEQEQLEQERLEQERLEQERLEQERLEQEQLEQERLEQERLARHQLAAEVEATAGELRALGYQPSDVAEAESAFDGFIDSEANAPANADDWFNTDCMPEDLFAEDARDEALATSGYAPALLDESSLPAALAASPGDEQVIGITPLGDSRSTDRQIFNDDVGFDGAASDVAGDEESGSQLLSGNDLPVSGEALTANFGSGGLPAWWSEEGATEERGVESEPGQHDTIDFGHGRATLPTPDVMPAEELEFGETNFGDLSFEERLDEGFPAGESQGSNVDMASLLPAGELAGEGELADEGEAVAPTAEEDSVEDYMRKLLARMRGVPEEEVELPASAQPAGARKVAANATGGPAAANAAPTVSSWKPTREKNAENESKAVAGTAATLGLTGDATLPFDPEKYVPRALAPEEAKSLTAMRELANTTARTAIHKSTRQRYVTMVLLKMAIAGVGLIVASVLIAINGFNLNIGLIATFASLVVAAIWGYDAVTGLKPLLEASFVLNPDVGGNQQTRDADEAK